MPHLKYIDNGEVKQGWRAYRPSYIKTDGTRVIVEGTMGEALSYMAEGCETDGRANVKHQQHAPAVITALQSAPDELEFTFDHIAIDQNDGSINESEYVPVLKVTAGQLRDYASACVEYKPTVNRVTANPSLPASLVGEKAKKTRNKNIAPLEF